MKAYTLAHTEEHIHRGDNRLCKCQNVIFMPVSILHDVWTIIMLPINARRVLLV